MSSPIRTPLCRWFRVEDYYTQGRHGWMRLHEKGAKRHEIEQVPDGVSFLKFASRPEWLRLRLPMREQPKVALAFIPLR